MRKRWLTYQFAQIDGIERINILFIRWSSMVRNLIFLEAFSGLEKLNLSGHQLCSLDGLQWFRRGKMIDIETGKNHKRNIEMIAETNIETLTLDWVKPSDTDAISQNRDYS